MEMKVNLSYKAEKEYTATNEQGNEVNIDMYGGEEKSHQSPMQLLLSALSACAAVDIAMMVKKRRKELVDMTCEVVGHRVEDSYPQRFEKIDLHYKIISPDLTQEEADRIVDLATTKYCSVAGSVNSIQTHDVQVIRP